MNTQVYIWLAYAHARHVHAHIKRVQEGYAVNSELAELADFAHTSIADVKYFLSAMTTYLREQEKHHVPNTPQP